MRHRNLYHRAFLDPSLYNSLGDMQLLKWPLTHEMIFYSVYMYIDTQGYTQCKGLYCKLIGRSISVVPPSVCYRNNITISNSLRCPIHCIGPILFVNITGCMATRYGYIKILWKGIFLLSTVLTVFHTYEIRALK